MQFGELDLILMPPFAQWRPHKAPTFGGLLLAYLATCPTKSASRRITKFTLVLRGRCFGNATVAVMAPTPPAPIAPTNFVENRSRHVVIPVTRYVDWGNRRGQIVMCWLPHMHAYAYLEVDRNLAVENLPVAADEPGGQPGNFSTWRVVINWRPNRHGVILAVHFMEYLRDPLNHFPQWPNLGILSSGFAKGSGLGQ